MAALAFTIAAVGGRRGDNAAPAGASSIAAARETVEAAETG
jgi:hypothetical protein